MSSFNVIEVTSSYMNAILHIRFTESINYYPSRRCNNLIPTYAYIFKELLLFRQGYVLMNLLNLVRDKIIKSFPEISEEELHLRLQILEELIQQMNK